MADPDLADKADREAAHRDRFRATLLDITSRRAERLRAIAARVAAGALPRDSDVEELELLDKTEAAVRLHLSAVRRRFEIGALIVLALGLALLNVLRVGATSADFVLRATGVQFTMSRGSTAALIPGEAGQVLLLRKARIWNYESVSPPDLGRARGVQLSTLAPPAATDTSSAAAPPLVLQAVSLQPGTEFRIEVGVAYDGNDRGINLGTRGDVPVTASFGEPIAAVSSDGEPVFASRAVTVEGKELDLQFYPAEQSGELTIFRDVRISDISFERDGHSTILSGTAHINGVTENLAMQPSDLLTVESPRTLLLREMTLVDGELTAILSAPEATTVLVGKDDRRDLRPTYLQWLLFRWPAQLYAVLGALVAVWLSLRRWWSGGT